jgi:magnesium transporter
MLSTYALDGSGLVRRQILAHTDEARPAIDAALWLDLLEPNPDEERVVEQTLGINVPTREEMREIESSNRMYEEDGALYLTTTLVTRLDTEQPQNAQITFILKNGKLVTNRYTDPLPFRRYASYAERHGAVCNSHLAIFAGLVEAMVNRIADVVERLGSDLDAVSSDIFGRYAALRRRAWQRDYRGVLERIGQSGELIAKTRESLVSIGRMLAFAQQSGLLPMSNEHRTRLRTVARDVTAMSDHVSFLGTNVSFMLDATLGMISIDQNNILKIFSVVTVFLLPPSVIGAAYGMNFEHIPGAHEPWGFAVALLAMAASAVVPWLLFKRRGWL